MDFEAVVQERPLLSQAGLNSGNRRIEPGSSPEMVLGGLGVSVQELTPDQRQSYKLNADHNGVVIVKVDQLSPAAEAGLETSDLILEINKHPVRSLLEYQKLVSHLKREDVVMLNKALQLSRQ